MGKMTSGLYKPKGMIQDALIGIGTAVTVGKLLPDVQFQYKEEAGAFVTSGIVGAGAVYALKHFSGAGTSSSGTQYQ